MGKNLLLLLSVLLLCLAAGCQAEIAGPIPEYMDQAEYISPHRRVPQSQHGLTGTVSDVHLEVLKNSERLHIGNKDETSNEALPAYEIFCAEDSMLIRVYARNVQNSIWGDKLTTLARESSLVEAVSWQTGDNDLCAEFLLELNQPVLYRTWYYVNACFFTIEFIAKTNN